MNDLPPFPPLPTSESAPAPARVPLSHTWQTILAGLVLFALMGFLGILNGVTNGALTLPPQLVPLQPYLVSTATLACLWLIRGITTNVWDLPAEKQPSARCDTCERIGQEAPCEHAY